MEIELSNPGGAVTAVRFQPVAPVGEYGAAAGLAPFPLQQPEALLTYSGTVALHQAFRALNLPAGSVVLCPSYNCGHELEPILRLGLKVECYRITADVQPDLEDIRSRLSSGRIGAVLFTHYFGVGYSLKALRESCDRWGAYLVEDCAHALLSDNDAHELGRIGDASAYSIRKFLPIANGGAVVINNPRLRLDADLGLPPALSTWLKQVELRKKAALHAHEQSRSWATLSNLFAAAPQTIAAAMVRKLCPGRGLRCYDPDDDNYRFDSRILSWRIADASRAAIAGINWTHVFDRRRDNYRYLDHALRSMAPQCLMLPELADGVCPLFLPVRVRNRMEAYRYLARRGVHSGLWWPQLHPAVDWSLYPDAVRLKQQGLALPVHQDLGRRHMDYMVRLFQEEGFLTQQD